MLQSFRVTRRIEHSMFACLASVAIACSSRAGRSASSASPNREIRALTILPRSASICPGDVIGARYEARLADGSRATLGASDMQRFYRSGDAVDPRDDGGWATDQNPFVSVISGFRLRAVLKSDTSVYGDTVVAPSYTCTRPFVDLRGALFRGAVSAYVRLGVLRTPFHDSIVVAAIELSEQRPRMFILGPGEMRSGAIRIDASGAPGAAGRTGSPGSQVGPCQSVGRGGNGDDGGTGASGGQVDVIIQSDAPWLADLVFVSNLGGRGGAGGRAGAGDGRPAALVPAAEDNARPP